ncbi:hypothetical protein HY642_05625 [Candidatus Woesearchaeota archaeon]|nr:hypothetical protein [Candidatus Woesearchaeota archaeon]
MAQAFRRESAFLGENFEDIIEREGGKAAGLRLLDAGLSSFGTFKIPYKPLLRVPRYVIPAAVYRGAEPLIAGCEDWRENKPLSNYLRRVMNDCKREFPYHAVAGNSRYSGVEPALFHLRSSSTNEDFRDTRLYGTYGSVCEPFFSGKPPEGLSYMAMLMTLFCNAKRKPHPTHPVVGAADALAMVLMPTVRGKQVIAYSSNPEEPGSHTTLEISEQEFGGGFSPLQLVHVGVAKKPAMEGDDCGEKLLFNVPQARGFNIVVYQAQQRESLQWDTFRDLEYWLDVERRKNPYIINDDQRRVEPSKCGISEMDIYTIHRFARRFERVLGYAVNLELIVTEDAIFPVQLRPVPSLPENRPVKTLNTLPSDSYCLAETPFVIGSYKFTAPLVMAEDKNGYVHHKFDRPVILLHAEHYKGHRFFFNDPNCVALLNPTEGAALTHNCSLVPPFSPERDRFAFMGVPGLMDELQPCLEMREVSTAGFTQRFHYTPFEVTIESDGRRGRLYVSRQDAKSYLPRLAP